MYHVLDTCHNILCGYIQVNKYIYTVYIARLVLKVQSCTLIELKCSSWCGLLLLAASHENEIEWKMSIHHQLNSTASGRGKETYTAPTLEPEPSQTERAIQ